MTPMIMKKSLEMFTKTTSIINAFHQKIVSKIEKKKNIKDFIGFYDIHDFQKESRHSSQRLTGPAGEVTPPSH